MGNLLHVHSTMHHKKSLLKLSWVQNVTLFAYEGLNSEVYKLKTRLMEKCPHVHTVILWATFGVSL